jgi:hypothetical protein
MRVIWDAEEDRIYSAGVAQGMLYPGNAPGVAWNGLISVTNSGGQTQDPKYFDGQRYKDRGIPSGFSGTISAYTYPEELESFIGISGAVTGQNRSYFGLSYRTNNEIHIVYNVLAGPSKHEYATIGAQIEPAAFEWSFTTKPVKIPGGKPSSHIVILVDRAKLSAISDLEALIYGDDVNEPSLPPFEDVFGLFESSAILKITDNGDGTWTAIGPDSVITESGDGLITINWPSVVIIDSTTFRVSSL